MNSTTCILSGYVCGEPEVKTTLSGKTIINFSLSVYAKFKKSKDDENKKHVSFLNIQYWPYDKQPGMVQTEINKIKKGELLAFNAEPIQERWEQDGNKRSRIIFNVEGFISVLHHRQKTSEPATKETTQLAKKESAPWEDDLPF